MTTWVGSTVVNVEVAKATFETGARAIAHEAIDHVQTKSVIMARVRSTLVDINLTGVAIVAKHALTLKHAHFVPASASIFARIICAFVDIYFTICSFIARRTLAFVVSVFVHA